MKPVDQLDGTFTFLFTDIEGSTRLLQALGDGYPGVLARHDAIIRGTAADHGPSAKRSAVATELTSAASTIMV